MVCAREPDLTKFSQAADEEHEMGLHDDSSNAHRGDYVEGIIWIFLAESIRGQREGARLRELTLASVCVRATMMDMDFFWQAVNEDREKSPDNEGFDVHIQVCACNDPH